MPTYASRPLPCSITATKIATFCHTAMSRGAKSHKMSLNVTATHIHLLFEAHFLTYIIL